MCKSCAFGIWIIWALWCIVMYCDVLWCTQNYKKAWRWRENSRQATGGYQSRRQFQGFQWSKAQGLRKFMCYDNSMTVLWCTVLWCTMMYYEHRFYMLQSLNVFWHFFFLHFCHFIVKEKKLICWTPGEPKRSPTNLCPALPDSPCAIWWSLDKISQTAHTQTHRHTGSRDIPCMETQLVTGVLSKANTFTNYFFAKKPTVFAAWSNKTVTIKNSSVPSCICGRPQNVFWIKVWFTGGLHLKFQFANSSRLEGSSGNDSRFCCEGAMKLPCPS